MKVLYFAWLRQKVGVGEETVAPPDSVVTVADLMSWLAGRSGGHADAFRDLSVVRVAVNQEYAGFDRAVTSGDEIAFFPPVTGG